MEELKSKDIERRSGASKIQLVHWVNSGAIIPRVDDRRRGGVRYFSKENLFEAIICKRLNEWRLPVHLITALLSHVRGTGFYKAFLVDENIRKRFLVAVPLKSIGGYVEQSSAVLAGLKKTGIPKEAIKFIGQAMLPQVVSADHIAGYMDHFKSTTAIVIDLKQAATEACNTE